MIGILKGMATTLSTLFRKPVTYQYPKERMPVGERWHGAPVLLWDEAVGEPFCTGCGLCARECLPQAITVSMKENEKSQAGSSSRKRIVDVFELDMGRCIFCACCVDACNFDAIVMSKHDELASSSRTALVADVNQLLELGKDASAKVGRK